MTLNIPPLSTLWRWMERHAVWFAILTAALSVFILCDPCGRKAWDTFFTHNEKVLEIYWQTLSLLLMILVPVSLEAIKKLETDLAGFGSKVFLEEVVHVYRFWILIPFSFLLFFAKVPVRDILSDSVIIDPEILTSIHYLLFVIWCFLFWWFLSLIEQSLGLLISSGKSVLKFFHSYLGGYSKREKPKKDEDSEEESWRLLWRIIDFQKEKWHRKFLLLFWNRQGELIKREQYFLATTLLESFSQQYLALGDSQKKSDTTWMNSRKCWLWFHEKQMNDKTENPYAIAIRLLDIHFATWRNFEEIQDPANRSDVDNEKWVRLTNLQRLVRSMLETLFRDELGKTDDYYYSFSRCLTGFFNTVALDKPTLSPEKYQEYLESLPVYRPVFEAAHNFHLSNYEPRAEGSGFPNRWRVLEACLEQTNGIDNVQRHVWLEQFLIWSRDRIDHGKKEWDNALDGALKMLFPEAYAPWMAFAFAYRALAFGKSRIAGLCSWHQNFGQSQATWTDISDIAQGANWQALSNQREQEEEQKQKDVAAKIIQRFSFFGTSGDIQTLIDELENLSGTFEKECESERKRLEILEMLKVVGGIGSFTK